VASGEVQSQLKGGEFRGILLSPDGKTLATTEIEFAANHIDAVDMKLIILDTTTGKKQTILDNCGDHAWLWPIIFSPDGTKLAAYGRVWDAATGEEIASYSSEGFPEFLPDGRLALCNRDGLKFCDLANG